MLLLLAIACAHTVDVAALPAPGLDAAGPATVARLVYPDAPAGSARALHNAAVAAERRGDIQGAFDLAREAYVARPTRRGITYVHDLEARLEAMGGVADGR